MAFWGDFRKGFGQVWNPIIEAAPTMIKAAGAPIGGAVGTFFAPGAGTAAGSAIGAVAGQGLGKLAEDIPRFAGGGYVGGGMQQFYNPIPQVNSYAMGGQVGAGFQNVAQNPYAPQQQQQQPPMGTYGNQQAQQQMRPMGQPFGASPQMGQGQNGANAAAPRNFAAGGGVGLQDAINLLPYGGYR
jgi:hypothetical protein